MATFFLVTGAVIIAMAVSAVARKTAGFGQDQRDHHIPGSVAGSDFGLDDDGWMLVVFTSSKCETCATVVEAVSRIDMPNLATAVIEIERMPELHTSYAIDAVPTTIVADPDGVVRKSFLGPVDLPMIELAVSTARSEWGSGHS